MTPPYTDMITPPRSTGRALAAAFAFAATSAAVPAQSTAVTPPRADDEPVMLSEFNVSTDADRGYIATNATTGAKVNTPLKDIPASLSVINSEFIRDIAAQDLNEILRYATGVFVTDGAVSEILQVRGFNVSTPLLDGFRESPTRPSEQVHIDRVEVLRGPSAVLYGNTSGIGGIINRTTKPPDFKTPRGWMQVVLRDHDWRQASLNLTGPVGTRENLAYRLVINAIQADSIYDYASTDRIFINPTLAWRPGRKTQVNVSIFYLNQKVRNAYPYDQWINAGSGHSNPGTLLRTPVKFNAAETVSEFDAIQGNFIQTLTHKFNDRWQLKEGFFLNTWHDLKDEATTGSTLLSVNSSYLRKDGTTARVAKDEFIIVRRPASDDISRFNVSLQADLVGQFDTGAVPHKIATGFEYAEQMTYNNRRSATMAAVNIFAPAYGALPFNFVNTSRSMTMTASKGIYVTDGMEFFRKRILLNLGARYDQFGNSTRPSAVVANQFVGLPKTTYDSPGKYSPRAGLVWRVAPNFSLYYSYIEAFVPQSTVNPDGGTFDALTGTQNEVGAKLDFLAGRVTLQTALFDVRQQNIIETDPVRTGYSVQVGDQQSKGIDFSIQAMPIDSLQLMASYSYTDAHYEDSIRVAQIGLPLVNVPHNRIQAFAKYTFIRGPFTGLGLGGGLNQIDNSRLVSSLSTDGKTVVLRSVPRYTLYDLSLSYARLKPCWFAVNVRNIFNTRYYTGGDFNRFYRGPPRQLVFTARRTF